MKPRSRFMAIISVSSYSNLNSLQISVWIVRLDATSPVTSIANNKLDKAEADEH